jgi:hypothetical protein
MRLIMGRERLMLWMLAGVSVVLAVLLIILG